MRPWDLRGILTAAWIAVSAIPVLLSPTSALAQSPSSSTMATVTTKDHGAVAVRNFQNGTGSDSGRIAGQWRGGNVSLAIADLASITVREIARGVWDRSHWVAELQFKDGRVDSFALIPHWTLVGQSEFGPWSVSWDQVARIEFGAGQAAVAGGAGSEPSDRISLKSGDTVLGTIRTDQYTLDASYGSVKFERQKIRGISFEGDGQNIDIVGL